jgi:hypothetical protein
LITYLYWNELHGDVKAMQYDGGFHLLSCKLIASVSFHLTIHSNISNALDIMKYSLDHEDKFMPGAASACFCLGLL